MMLAFDVLDGEQEDAMVQRLTHFAFKLGEQPLLLLQFLATPPALDLLARTLEAKFPTLSLHVSIGDFDLRNRRWDRWYGVDAALTSAVGEMPPRAIARTALRDGWSAFSFGQGRNEQKQASHHIAAALITLALAMHLRQPRTDTEGLEQFFQAVWFEVSRLWHNSTEMATVYRGRRRAAVLAGENERQSITYRDFGHVRGSPYFAASVGAKQVTIAECEPDGEKIARAAFSLSHWAIVAESVAQFFNRQLAAAQRPPGAWHASGETRMTPDLGESLCVLAWSIEGVGESAARQAVSGWRSMRDADRVVQYREMLKGWERHKSSDTNPVRAVMPAVSLAGLSEFDERRTRSFVQKHGRDVEVRRTERLLYLSKALPSGKLAFAVFPDRAHRAKFSGVAESEVKLDAFLRRHLRPDSLIEVSSIPNAR